MDWMVCGRHAYLGFTSVFARNYRGSLRGPRWGTRRVVKVPAGGCLRINPHLDEHLLLFEFQDSWFLDRPVGHVRRVGEST
jgi:hypothetical protein